MARPLSLSAYRAMMGLLSPLLGSYLKKRLRQGKEDAHRLDERYGRYALSDDIMPNAAHTIWLHGVSVGEVTAALSMVEAFMATAIKPDNLRFIITTGTVTAAKIVTEKARVLPTGLPIIHRYLPFDAPAYVTRFFAHYQPDFGVIFESDFWPSLMSIAHERAIPLYLASAQMSHASFAKWRKQPALAKALFGPIAHCYSHDEQQAAHFTSLGAQHVTVTGSLKLPAIISGKTDFAKAITKASEKRLVLLGASTHHGEEAQLIALSDYLRAQNTPHLLIIAPRHPERGDAVAQLCPHAKRRSVNALPASGDDIYLSDSLGDMPSLYQAADIVWLGATFADKGGHNPIEAASYGKPIICGPSDFKNKYEFDQLRALGFCTQIEDISQSARFISELFQDKDRYQALAKAGKAYAKSAQKRTNIVANAIYHDMNDKGYLQ